MSELKEKIDILEKNGFKYISDRDIYCKPKAKECFSFEFVEDNPKQRIIQIIEKPRKETGGLILYFNHKPSKVDRESIERDIVARFPSIGRIIVRSNKKK